MQITQAFDFNHTDIMQGSKELYQTHRSIYFMKCIVEDGKDAVSLNNVDRYCYEHYQVYKSLKRLYQQLYNSNKSISWQEYLTKVLDITFTAPWKMSIIDDRNGRILPSIASVASIELKQ